MGKAIIERGREKPISSEACSEQQMGVAEHFEKLAHKVEAFFEHLWNCRDGRK
jgi:hypothetical protein